MTDQPLGERRKSLEEEFFRKQNAELVERLRTERERGATRELMATASGISDTAVLDRLIDQGMTPATLAALALAPLVAVAWADRKLEEKERKAVLTEAAASGVTAGTAGHELLESWLNEQPPPALMSTWTEYATAFASSLGDDQRREFREALVARATAVGNAAGGGFAGMGSKLSPAEQSVLTQIESALSG